MHFRHFVYAIAALVLVGCKSGQKQMARPDFSADSAYMHIENQLQFGPRVPNSMAHTVCAAYLVEQLRNQGAQVELQRGQMTDYSGRSQQVYNIFGRITMPGLENREHVLLCAHYDTRPWCDNEPEYENRFLNVPGANDGASGVAVLLEVARQLHQQVLDSTLKQPVDIVFFDCEDMGTPEFYTGPERENTWCLGSQLWATEYIKHLVEMPKYKFAILLDMVGAPGAVFPKEGYSTTYAGNYQEMIWRQASQLGYGNLFTSEPAYPITDDHFYVNTWAGIPCVDIIHYDIHNTVGFASWWHTRQDNLDNIDRNTLQAVGEVVLSVL